MLSLCKHCGREFKVRNRTQTFCSILCANRAHLNNKHSNLSLPKNHSEELAELFGILLGDGSVTKYFTKVFLNLAVEREYAPFVRSLFLKLFSGVPVSVWEKPNRGVIEVQISSVDVGAYLRNVGFDPKSRAVPVWIMRNPQFVKATLRGLFDTEGSVGIKYYHGKKKKSFYKQLTVTNINQNILTFLEEGLIANGLKPTLRSKKNIYISNGLDIQRYIDDIGSHNPKLLAKLHRRQIGEYVYTEGWQRGLLHRT